MYFDSEWIEIKHQDQEGTGNHPFAWRLAGGEAVLYGFLDKFQFFRRSEAPGAAKVLPCRWHRVSVSADGERISCTECRWPALNGVTCWGGDVTVYRSDATVVGRYLSDLPGQIGGHAPTSVVGLGFLDGKTPLVVAQYNTQDVNFDTDCVLIAMEEARAWVIADAPEMRHCDSPESWRNDLPAGSHISLQEPVRLGH